MSHSVLNVPYFCFFAKPDFCRVFCSWQRRHFSELEMRPSLLNRPRQNFICSRDFFSFMLQFPSFILIVRRTKCHAIISSLESAYVSPLADALEAYMHSPKIELSRPVCFLPLRFFFQDLPNSFLTEKRENKSSPETFNINNCNSYNE